MKTKARRKAVIALDKSKRLPSNNPRKHLLPNTTKRRSKKADWKQDAKEAWNSIFEDLPKVDPLPPARPPNNAMADVITHYSATNKTQPETQQKAAALELINNTSDQDITIYTDGSVVDSNSFGGAGLHIVETSPSQLVDGPHCIKQKWKQSIKR